MTQIQSAADVRRVFPGAVINEKEINVDTIPSVRAFADSKDIEMAGNFRVEELAAIIYWSTHKDEFKQVST